MNAIDAHVGARLRARRLLIQMSDSWLAGQLEVTASDIKAMEEGRLRITHDHLLQLIDLLDVPERYFYQDFGKPPSNAETKSSWVRDVDRWFRDHVSPHERLFLKVAHHLTGNLEAARDLVHDAYAKVLAGDRWRTVENPRAYVRKAVTTLALDLIKRKKIVPMEQYAEAEIIGFADLSPDAFETVSDRERLRIVMEALDKLPTQCRRVFIMRRIEDIQPRDIAKRLGIGVGTVEGHLTRGMLELNKHLENQRKGAELKTWIAKRAHEEQVVLTDKERRR
ncbi:RNA polymerase sigma factor [Asticcacaulis sp.]|uniref:RNA polymerase sigma factor n=1 Tax=Asticcacaulis sp. TaxID=1872648 RepID=UPI002C9FCCDD|nr:RNA polymerase sigma factor [Asticcacaulis sp.]HTM81562.1 RNA polymerase sigma factor [Asticcacaulis sp.]